MSHTFFLTALNFVIGKSYEVIITGSKNGEDTKEMLKALGERYIPNKIVLFVPIEDACEVTDIAKYAKAYPITGRATAYVCHNYSCNQSTTSIYEMLNLLKT
jgi:uncharacterized protein YyaL (SSP411 family)